MNYKISHPTKVVECEIDLPTSKSISNRLLIIRALCEESFEIENLSDSDDTKSLIHSLNTLENTIDVAHAGTTFRFLTSYLAIQNGTEFILTGSDRLKERPIKELIEVLKMIGAKIEYLENDGFAPIKISGSKLKGGFVEIDGGISSQFISSILLISPVLQNGMQLKINSDLVSKPYIEMTLKLMSEFGIHWEWNENNIEITPQKYVGKNIAIESDWSAVTFWFEIAALAEKCNIKLNGLFKESIQGDKKVVKLFENLGVASVFKNNQLILTKNGENSLATEIDLLETPDMYQSLKCTLSALSLNPKITGLQTLKDKETNRMIAVKNELEKLKSSKEIETYKDHRMAMSFAPLCLKFGELQINNSEVVSKSYPNFWEDLKTGGFTIVPSTD